MGIDVALFHDGDGHNGGGQQRGGDEKGSENCHFGIGGVVDLVDIVMTGDLARQEKDWTYLMDMS